MNHHQGAGASRQYSAPALGREIAPDVPGSEDSLPGAPAHATSRISAVNRRTARRMTFVGPTSSCSCPASFLAAASIRSQSLRVQMTVCFFWREGGPEPSGFPRTAIDATLSDGIGFSRTDDPSYSVRHNRTTRKEELLPGSAGRITHISQWAHRAITGPDGRDRMPRLLLAKKAGISRDTLYRLFQGEATQKTIDAVAGVLGISAPKLMLLADAPPPETPVQLLRSAQDTIELAIAALATGKPSAAAARQVRQRLVAEPVRPPSGRKPRPS